MRTYSYVDPSPELGAASIRCTRKEFLNPALLFEYMFVGYSIHLFVQQQIFFPLARISSSCVASFEGGYWILSNSCVARISNYLSICPNMRNFATVLLNEVEHAHMDIWYTCTGCQVLKAIGLNT